MTSRIDAAIPHRREELAAVRATQAATGRGSRPDQNRSRSRLSCAPGGTATPMEALQAHAATVVTEDDQPPHRRRW